MLLNNYITSCATFHPHFTRGIVMAFSLALSGGGCRAAAHIGVIKALSENGLYPSAISGTSAGAIVAALAATCCSAEQLLEICNKLKFYGPKLLDWNISGILSSSLFCPFFKRSCLLGILRGKRLYTFLDVLFGDTRINDISVPIFITATDLLSGNTVSFSQIKPHRKLPDTIWINDISVKDAVYSSCCLPAIFTPIKTPFGFWVDGGVSNNLPVDLLFAADAPNIIAVDISDIEPDDSISGLFEAAHRSVNVMGNKLQKCYVRGERLSIRPKLPQKAGVFSFDMMEQCIDAGYNAASELIPIIKML